MEHSLAHPDLLEERFLSFVRLTGTVYFKKHLTEFTLDSALYMSLSREVCKRDSSPLLD